MTHVLAWEPGIYGASQIQERTYSRSLDHCRPLSATTFREHIRTFLLKALGYSSVGEPCSGSGFISNSSTVPVITARTVKRQYGTPRDDTLEVRLHDALDSGEIPPSLDPGRFLLFLEVLRSGLEVQAQDGANEAQLLTIIDLTLEGWDAYIRRSSHVTVIAEASGSCRARQD
ncbi:hypothetical protein [Sphingomonas sp. 3-13AW]|uniref:hypothetical protein n=1 Tax=Sphingomonas sp. 3-13AW TaxID=3050450 RepID=UPI003BB4E385